MKRQNLNMLSGSMMIEQIKIPENWNVFVRKDSKLLSMLKPLTNHEKPAFFFSTTAIYDVLKNHTGPAVIIVNNTVNPIKKCINEIKSRKNIYFISTSALTSIQLDELGLSYVEFPASLMKPQPQPQIKGSSIYFYSALGEQRFYGYFRIKEILESKFPHINLICAQGKKSNPINPKKRLYENYLRNDLYNKIYPKVFLSIRLTPRDGLSASVQELGLRGIKTIWNGGTPSALSYKTDDDIINHIKNEEKLIGTSDANLADRVSNFINPTNPQYSHIFNLDTYTNNLPTPKFFNV